MRSHNTAIGRQRSGQKSLALIAAGVAILGFAACSGTPAPAGSSAKAASVAVIAPADPGGGWDQTARALSSVATKENIVSAAPVTNIGGAGGTVGLASLANEKNPRTLFITGLVMVGAVETNESKTRIENTTPIARLTEEALVIAVPRDSPFRTLKDLVEAVKAQGTGVTIAGGSAGGADHILAGRLLVEAGISADKVPETLNYIANSGGGAAVTMLLGGQVSAGISGIGEFSEHINAGTLRALAVSSAERNPLLKDVPTITEAGYKVELTNWRGILAPQSISEADKTALLDVVSRVHDSPEWKKTLADRGWDDAFLLGDEFKTFLTQNISEVKTTLKNIGLVK